MILGQIADCDALHRDRVAGCAEFGGLSTGIRLGRGTGKPVLPVAVEPLPKALPGRYSRRQIVDYSEPGQRAALTLAGGLTALPAAPALPEPLPASPPPPLSYLTELVDQVTQENLLTAEQQREIVHQLEAALRSVDPDEREGASDILDRFRSRRDLDADIDSLATKLTEIRIVPREQSMPNMAAAAATLTEPETGNDCARLLGSDGQIIAISADGLRIGRMPDNELVLADPKVSRHHAVIVTTPDGFILRDLGSSNGTKVGDTKILESQLLMDGDEIHVGDQSWIFERLEAPEG